MHEKLKRISTYAKFMNLSKEMIRVRIIKGLVKSVTIDNTVFIELTDEEFERFKKE